MNGGGGRGERWREGGREREGETEEAFSFSQYQWGCRHALMRFQSMLHFPSDPISLLEYRNTERWKEKSESYPCDLYISL